MNKMDVFVFRKTMLDIGFPLPHKASNAKIRHASVYTFLEYLFKYGYLQVNAVNIRGESLLYWLCKYYEENDLTDIVELVCKHGANVNYCHPEDGSNPLMALIKRTSFWPQSIQTLKAVTSIFTERDLDVFYVNNSGEHLITVFTENDKLSNGIILEQTPDKICTLYV